MCKKRNLHGLKFSSSLSLHQWLAAVPCTYEEGPVFPCWVHGAAGSLGLYGYTSYVFCAAAKWLWSWAVLADLWTDTVWQLMHFTFKACVLWMAWCRRVLCFPGECRQSGDTSSFPSPNHDIFRAEQSVTQGFLQVWGLWFHPGLCILHTFLIPCGSDSVILEDLMFQKQCLKKKKSCGILSFPPAPARVLWILNMHFPWGAGLCSPLAVPDKNAWSCGWTLRGAFLYLEVSSTALPVFAKATEI